MRRIHASKTEGQKNAKRTHGAVDALFDHFCKFAMNNGVLVVFFVLVLAGCASAPGIQTQDRVPITPPREATGSPVVREPVATLPLPPSAPDTERVQAPAMVPVVVPPNTLYVCVVDRQRVRQQTAIEFSTKVGKLCRRHPEMGPCKYERNLCRASGGRVFAANGVEITQLTEADYDKRVLRVVLRAD
jgi:hypothetical protein